MQKTNFDKISSIRFFVYYAAKKSKKNRSQFFKLRLEEKHKHDFILCWLSKFNFDQILRIDLEMPILYEIWIEGYYKHLFSVGILLAFFLSLEMKKKYKKCKMWLFILLNLFLENLELEIKFDKRGEKIQTMSMLILLLASPYTAVLWWGSEQIAPECAILACGLFELKAIKA